MLVCNKLGADTLHVHVLAHGFRGLAVFAQLDNTLCQTCLAKSTAWDARHPDPIHANQMTTTGALPALITFVSVLVSF